MTIKTLLVDDERSLLEQAKIFLERREEVIEVSTASSAEKALDMLDEKEFDVIVSEYQIPHIDGLDFLEAIREERNSEIPFIIFTGKGREEVAMKALNLGADRYLQKGEKPKIQYGVLAEAIVQEVAHHRSEEKYRTVVENSNDAIYIYRNDKFLFANKKTTEVTGYNKEELTDMNVWSLIHPDDRERIKRIEEAREKGENAPSKYQTRIITKDGDVRHFQLMVSPIDYEGKKAILGSARDITEIKRKEKKLKESKSWLDQMIDGISVPLFVIDDEHTVTHWNQSLENLMGINKEEVVGTKDPWTAFYDEERPVLADLVLDDASEDEIESLYGDRFEQSEVLDDAYETEDYFPEMGNDGKWLFFTASPIKDLEGRKIGAIETMQDTTERKKFEEEVKEKHRRLKTLMDNVPGMVYRCENNRDWTMRFISEGCFTLTGYEPDELIDDDVVSYAELVHSDDRDRIWNEIQKAVDKNEPFELEYRIKTSSGEIRWVWERGRAIDSKGEKEYLEGLITDITDRKEVEKRIHENKNKIERLHEISAELQTYDSEEDVYSFAIEAAEDILDFDICSFDAVEGDKFVVKETSSSTPENGYTGRQIDEGGLGSKTYLNQESYLVNDISSNKDAKPEKSEYRSAISIPVGEQGVFQAVSTEVNHFDEEDLKTAELLVSHVCEAIKRIQMKEREEFLHSLLRHDVGNKNQIVEGYLKLMRNHELSDEVKDFVDKSHRAIKESKEIIGKVRNLRKIDEEKEISEIGLSSVIDHVLSEHRDQLQEKGINIDRGEVDCKVRGGPLVEELFSNIIENSIQHSKCDKIKIHSRFEEDECVVTVEDDGSGISDDIKGKIFDKGFRDEESAGTGLGLYMVKEITENYGGSVEVKDSDLGGARFEVKLKRP